MRQTLAIIKPDAVSSGNAGKILAHLEEAGFTVRALRMTHLDDAQAGAFYEVHRERPFYGELVEFMTSGPVIPMAEALRRVQGPERHPRLGFGRERRPGDRLLLQPGGAARQRVRRSGRRRRETLGIPGFPR